jgi:mono/diheme cytochrome c family protein
MREMKAIVLLGCALMVCMISGAQCQEGKTRTTAEGVFTQEQAKSGEDTYQAQCAGCHGADLHSTDSEAPDLTDGSFKFGWVGKTVAEMFGTIRSTMPLNNGGSLNDQTYLDIVTYILQFNEIPSGPKKLEPDVQILKQIVIVAPK